MRDDFFKSLWVIAVLLALVLGLMNIWLGDLNQDEGWYLYAAKMVRQGELPYRDFAFTQAPVMPFVYTAAIPLVERWGVLGGRIFTFILALIGAGAATWSAYRFAAEEKRVAALGTFMLMMINCYQSYFTTAVKTYALCGLFLAAGFLFLSWSATRRGFISSLLAGVLLALAAGTRISAAICIPVVLAWLIWRRKGECSLAWVAFGVGALVTGALVFLPIFLASPENFWFYNLDYHASRATGSLLMGLVYKAGFLSRWARAYSIAFFLAVGLVFYLLNRRATRRRIDIVKEHSQVGAGVFWTAALGMTVIHFLAPFPYEDYQVAVFPLFAVALAIDGSRALSNAMRSNRLVTRFVAALLAISAIASFSSPINQDWMVIGRDLIWWKIKDKPDIVKLQETGELLRREAGRRDTILTQDIYLAVEAGLDVPHGMEMGPFCYYPDLSRTKAESLNVLNREMLEQVIRETDAPVAAVSEYGFSIVAPEITKVPPATRSHFIDLVEERYKAIEELPRFGQGHTLLKIYRLQR